MELSQEGAGAEPELLDENYCKMSKMSAEADQDDGEEDEQDDEAEDEEEEETLCYTFSADLLASGDIVDVTSNCVDMQGLSEAAVELMRPATILRKQPNNSQSLNLPSVVIHSASNTPKKKKRNTSTSSSQNQTKNNNNSDNKPNGGGGGIPKRSKSFHISSQKKRKISFENNFRTKKNIRFTYAYLLQKCCARFQSGNVGKRHVWYISIPWVFEIPTKNTFIETKTKFIALVLQNIVILCAAAIAIF